MWFNSTTINIFWSVVIGSSQIDKMLNVYSYSEVITSINQMMILETWEPFVYSLSKKIDFFNIDIVLFHCWRKPFWEILRQKEVFSSLITGQTIATKVRVAKYVHFYLDSWLWRLNKLNAISFWKNLLLPFQV